MTTLHSQLAQRGWYSQDPSALHDEITEYLEPVSNVPTQRPSAIIVPHAGYRYSGQIAASAFHHCKGFDFDRIFVVGPSHHYPLKNEASVLDADAFVTPLGTTEIDREIVKEMLKHPLCHSIEDLHEEEHSVQVELPFLQHVAPDSPVVPIILGECDNDHIEEMSKLIKPFLSDKSLMVISTEFTHYGKEFGYTPFAEQVAANIKALDIKACRYIASADTRSFGQFIDQTHSNICGRDAIRLLMQCFDEDQQQAGALLDYARSGDMTADYSHSVSYASMLFEGPWAAA